MCLASLLAVLGHWEWLQSQWNDAQWRVTGTQSVPQALQPATRVPSLVETLPPGNKTYSLSHSQMCNAEQVLAQARKRKRRTSIETNVKGTLESFFRKCVKPSPQEISQIAEDLNLDKDVGWEGGEDGCPNDSSS